MNFKKSIITSAIALSSLIVMGCGDSSDSNDTNVNKKTSEITFVAKNLAPLGDDYDYEGWLITPKGAIATGKFDITKGETTPHVFKVDPNDAKSASKFVLTIEPQNETGADIKNASSVHIIGGDIRNNTAILTTSHGTALGTDFSEATGKYILATPSNKNATPTQGIWFIDNSSGAAKPGLSLPNLPTGWKYEGWIVDGSPISTGTFLKANEADSDKAGSTAGTEATPAFPGQDFVNPAKDLIGKTAVISVEPDPDNSKAPFSIKPLVGTITNEAGKMVLANKAADNLPKATISIKNP